MMPGSPVQKAARLGALLSKRWIYASLAVSQRTLREIWRTLAALGRWDAAKLTDKIAEDYDLSLPGITDEEPDAPSPGAAPVPAH